MAGASTTLPALQLSPNLLGSYGGRLPPYLSAFVLFQSSSAVGFITTPISFPKCIKCSLSLNIGNRGMKLPELSSSVLLLSRMLIYIFFGPARDLIEERYWSKADCRMDFIIPAWASSNACCSLSGPGARSERKSTDGLWPSLFWLAEKVCFDLAIWDSGSKRRRLSLVGHKSTSKIYLSSRVTILVNACAKSTCSGSCSSFSVSSSSTLRISRML